MAIKWTELKITDANGDTQAVSLGNLVETAPENLDSATIANGRIAEWPQFFISAPGENPDWDTPREEVDWGGFPEALRIARAS
jgi:hypothetical protein